MLMSDADHQHLIEALDDFVAREVEPVARRIDQRDEFPKSSLSALGAAGYLGSMLPEPYGAGRDLQIRPQAGVE